MISQKKIWNTMEKKIKNLKQSWRSDKIVENWKNNESLKDTVKLKKSWKN